MNKFLKQNIFIIIWFFISTVSAINRSNNTFLNNFVNNKHKYSNKLMEPRGHESWGYLDGYEKYGQDVAYGKTDYYWLIPLVIVIGFGALLLPLLGTLMTTMITQGTINLTAGRRKRDIKTPGFQMSEKGFPEYLIGLLTKVEDAIDKFGNQIKTDVSPLISKLSEKHL